jgi:hypothetical protein
VTERGTEDGAREKEIEGERGEEMDTVTPVFNRDLKMVAAVSKWSLAQV